MPGFSLTITDGQDIGREFTFDQPEVSIGRTSENDVVLVDAGVSRRHAVIRSEGGRYFVQDQGSANGTQINGEPVVEEELQSGDLLGIGPVVLTFEAAAMDEENSTRILDTSTLAPPAPAPRRASPRSSNRGEPVALARRTAAMPAVKKKPATSLSRPGGARPPSKRPSSARPLPAPRGAAAGLSAAERARLQRNAKGIDKLKLWLMDKPPAVRYGVMGAGGLLALGLLLVIGKAVFGGGPAVATNLGDRSSETFPLTEQKSEDVYGLGDHLGVTVQTANEVQFEFEYSDSFPVVIYLRFNSAGIERKEEVVVTLNTVQIDTVNQSLGDEQREQRIQLPKKYLRPGEKNHIVFDNTLNPPGNEPWAISNVRLTITPLPMGTPSELLREARTFYDLAEKRLGMKDVHAANRYEAWSALGKALLYLEGVEPKPELFELVRQSLREVDRELDTTCNRLFLTAKRAEELGDFKQALDTYKGGLAWFPTVEHYCHLRLQEAIAEFE